MARGPNKQFDPETALQQAMLLFWEKGYAAASMTELQSRMGLGAKSLYDTFGNKRELFRHAISHYTNTVTRSLFDELSAQPSPMTAANNLLSKIASLDANGHKGCLLGVAMAQAQLADDEELAIFIDDQVKVIEDALFAAFESAKSLGELGQHVNSRDMARLYTAAFQGANLISRVRRDDSFSRSVGHSLQSLSTSTDH